jgi:hypothetical protein
VSWQRHSGPEGSGPNSVGRQTVWTKTINGTHVVVQNMYGQSRIHSGLGAHVEVWLHEHPDDPYGERGESNKVHTEWTVGEAKEWAEQAYG